MRLNPRKTQTFIVFPLLALQLETGKIINIHKLEFCITILEALPLSTKVLEEIREELLEIKHLYKELVDKLIPVEEATRKEKKAIAEADEIADEKELMQTLG